MNTAEIKAALRTRYAPPEWALMFEVGDATGAAQRRWADAVAMNLYPSRGLSLHGFEVKASRGDWLRELANPDKSVPVQQYCDHWWVVAPPGVVRDGELPPTWGMIEAKGGRLVQAVAAPTLEAQAVSRKFVAAMLRRASEADVAEISATVEKRVAELRASDRQSIEREIQRRTDRYQSAVDSIARVKEITGVDLAGWCDDEELGRAVRFVLDSGVLSSYAGIGHLQRLAGKFADDCKAAMAILPIPEKSERS